MWTDAQKKEIVDNHFDGLDVYCPDDRAVMRVTDMSSSSGAGRLFFCPRCQEHFTWKREGGVERFE